MASPICDQIDAVVRDATLTTAAKRSRAMNVRGEGCLAALRSLGLPHTIKRSTRRGELAVTIEAASHPLVGGILHRNAVRLRIAVALDGNPVDVDPDRVFVNPPLRNIVDDGDNETTVTETGIDNVEHQRTYRWREAPAAILIAELMRQVMATVR